MSSVPAAEANAFTGTACVAGPVPATEILGPYALAHTELGGFACTSASARASSGRLGAAQAALRRASDSVEYVTEQCRECGGSTTARSCEELFHRLLALDHQRDQPWASFHGINVACYLLQHPSAAAPRHQGAQLQIVSVFCDTGLEGLQRLTAEARRQNSHRAPTPTAYPRLDATDEPIPPPPGPAFSTTIQDVAVDGTFPAAGYAERVEQWARAVRTAWATTRTSNRSEAP